MNSLTNILLSKEKKAAVSQFDENENLFDRNLELIYKNDIQMAQESIHNVLSIQSIDKVKNLYQTPLHKSAFTVHVFENLKKGIAHQAIKKEDVNEEIMFHVFALKVSSYFNDLLKKSKFPSYDYLLEQPALFHHCISNQLEKIILKVSYRTLVLDMNMNREKGFLAGETPKEKYGYYNKTLLCSPEYLESFFQQYPVLLRVIGNELRKFKKFILEFISRFEKDKPELLSLFGFSEQVKIRDIEVGMGDSHSDGRKVTKITLNEGKLIYKPRSLEIDLLYKKIIEFLNEKIRDHDIKLSTPNVLSRDGYGWTEFISFKACNCLKDVQNFYQRTGAQIGLLYALKAVDFHSENLIANGSYPVLIDLESLFHPAYQKKKDGMDAYEKAETQLHKSVRALGLLPFFFAGKADISGIGRKGKAKSIIKVPQLINLKTAEMSVKRDYVEIDTANNHPMLENKFVYAKDYVEELKQGFSKAYMTILKHASELIRIIEKSENKIYVRFISKPTIKYSALLELSFHPRFLHNSIDREIFLSKIWERPKQEDEYQSIVKYEFNDLINNDIPYFKVKLNEKDLLSSKNKKIENYFPETPAQSVKERISNLSKDDLKFQLYVIELSMLASEDDRQIVLKEFIIKEPGQYENVFSSYQESILIEKAEELAAYIYNQSYKAHTDKGSSYSWLNATPIGVDEIQWNLSVMGDTFYDGLSGMAFTYLALWRVTKKEKYLDIAEKIMKDVVSRFIDIEVKPDEDSSMSVGAFSGVSSIVYTLMNFYMYTKREKYKQDAKQIAQLIPSLLPYDKELDIIGGTAGALIVMIRSFEIENDTFFLSLAEQCGSFLMKQAIFLDEDFVTWEGIANKPLTGFSHGNAGMIYALQLLEKHSKHQDISMYIRKGLAFENSKKVNGNWLDLRKTVNEAATSAWCHGSPGILLSRLELKDSKHPDIAEVAKKDLNKTVSNIFYDGFGREQSLCHGDMGNALILIEYGKKTGESQFVNIGKNLILESVQDKNIGFYQCGVGRDVETPNLMLGLAGIVYGMLYAADAELPNILNLEIGRVDTLGDIYEN